MTQKTNTKKPLDSTKKTTLPKTTLKKKVKGGYVSSDETEPGYSGTGFGA